MKVKGRRTRFVHDTTRFANSSVDYSYEEVVFAFTFRARPEKKTGVHPKLPTAAPRPRRIDAKAPAEPSAGLACPGTSFGRPDRPKRTYVARAEKG